MKPWVFFVLITVGCLICQSFFTMMEMAFVSFNRMRLQYYISRGSKKAKWLNKLLNNPIYLFGTTLIGVNFFLQLGSEASRSVYISLGLNPDFSAISQILLVVIFAELSPMFAARLHTEHVAMLGIGPIYFISRLLRPVIWILDGICRVVDWIIRSPKVEQHYLTREELQKAVEAKEEKHRKVKEEEFDTLIQNIFVLKGKFAKDLMSSLKNVKMFSFDANVSDTKGILEKYIPIYSGSRHHVIGLVYLRDLLKVPDTSRLKDVSKSVWFVSKTSSILQIVQQFRSNNQRVAIVLNETGKAVGLLTLDHIINEMFKGAYHTSEALQNSHAKVVVDRSFPAEFNVLAINKLLGISLPSAHEDSLEDCMAQALERAPIRGETIQVGSFELTLENGPLMSDKVIRITSL